MTGSPASTPGIPARLRRRLFGIAPRDIQFSHRGFRGGTSQVRAGLERVGGAFAEGYHAALEAPLDQLGHRLRAVEPAYAGFAHEGAAMGLALLDRLTPWKRDRLTRFLAGAGAAHVYMVHVGAGWAWARLPGGVEKRARSVDPVLGWLAVDGYGFHEGYFHWPSAVVKGRVPRGLSPYGRRVFDQGLGRSLWFVDGSEPERIATTIGTFLPERHPDLWSGVGLAAGYAGGVGASELESLRSLASEHLPELRQGVAFAAKARLHAGNPVPHTELACRLICRMSTEDAARVTDVELERAHDTTGEPVYETWRRGIRDHFLAREGAA